MNNFKKTRRSILSLVIGVVATLSLASAASLPLPTPEATASITAVDLKKHLTFLASDELGGRFTLSPSNRVAARYLASQLESYGFRGAAKDGSFLQRVPLSYRNVDRAVSRVILNIGGTKREFNYAEAFLSEGPADTSISGDLVFVGCGVSSPKNS